MKLEGQGQLLKIYIGESDQYHHQPLYHAIVLKARELGMAGATVTRGVEGFGANSRIHTANILRLSEDLPVVIEIADQPERIARLLGELDHMVTEGLIITIEDIRVVKYSHSTKV